MKMRRFVLLFLYQCVLCLLLSGTVKPADEVEVTNVDIPTDVPLQAQAKPTHSSEQVIETVSPVEDSQLSIQVSSSLSTSLTIDQSETSSIIEGTSSSTQIEPSFSEIQGTSQIEEYLKESVTQSTSAIQTDVTVDKASDDTTDSEKSVEDQTQIPVPVEQSENAVADDTEVKVTETLEDTKIEGETEPNQNATQLKGQDDIRDESVTHPPQKPSDTPTGGGPGVDSEVTEVSSDDKQEEEGLTFNEWTQKVLAEAEKGKQEAKDDTQTVQLPPVKQRKKKNYASQECGAKILASNPEASSPKSVLNSNRDEYMNNPCKAKRWFVLELCEPIQAHSVDIASLELFSSQPKKFKLFLSDRYPTKDWKLVGEFSTKDERAIQTFTLTGAEDYFAKFVRVELTEHYGNEHFCPLTIFRMLGVAVVDYEDDHHDLNVDDDDDDDNDDHGNVESDNEAGSRNLFTSAKDTVINIVKKVLNVESEEEQLIHNATQVNMTGGIDNSTLNGTTTTSEGDTLPCVPDVTSVGSEKKSCVDKTAEGHSEKTLPLTPEPGKTDNVLVVMLEDDEQVETTPDTAPGKSFYAHIHDCFLAMHSLSNSKKKHSKIQSKLCEFVYVIKRQSPVKRLSRKRLKKKSENIKEVKEETNKIVKPLDDSSDIKEEINTTVPLDVTHVEPVDLVSTVTDSDTESSASFSSDHVQSVEPSESKLLTSVDSEKSKVSETAKLSLSPTSTFIQVSSTQDFTDLTGTQVLSSTQSVDFASEKQTGSSTSSAVDQKEPSEVETIEPSPTSVDTPREMTTEASREATPVLPVSWKPDTKDLMQDRTETQNQKTSDSIPAPTDIKQKPEPTSVTIQAEETKVDPALNGQSIQPTKNGDTGSNMTTDIRDELEVLVRGTVEELPEQKANTTVIDEKVVVGNGGQQKLEDLVLVKLPAIPSGKRESAIMRLSNRIKVLEQNVSLSSRFLEELSRRYKKQSEDMMKMLNKTMASLHNMTVEADVKNKIHEDEMTAMERRLENLTQIVHELTHSFDNLNKQVTDRQMIWTTIEIAIIIFMLLFLHLRRKKVTLPPEVKSLIESMPSKPTSSHPQRRNSLSGPASPSKEKKFGNLHSGGGLQRFSSETALASAGTHFPVIHPTDSVFKQGADGIKKKKKKKHKNTNVGDTVQWENWSTQNSSQQSTNKVSQSKETSLQPLNINNQSKKETSQVVNKDSQCKEKCLHSSCSMPQTKSSCFGSLLSGWTNTPMTKQRSASLGTDLGADTSFAPVEETFNKGVQKDSKDCLGTKSGIKGVSKKPVQGGSKISPKLNLKNPKCSETGSVNERLYKNEMKLDEKWVVKGHRRQKSLPKQHYSTVETVGSMYSGSGSNGFQGNMKHFDTNPIPSKVQKKGEMKKSVSLPVSSESKFEKPPIYSKSFANGHTECNGKMSDAEQTENCYSLDKSKSDVFCSAKYGRNMFNDETFINGSPYTNGADCSESVYSSESQFNGFRNECNGMEYERTRLEPLVVDNTNSVKNGQNGTWKNMFGYFR